MKRHFSGLPERLMGRDLQNSRDVKGQNSQLMSHGKLRAQGRNVGQNSLKKPLQNIGSVPIAWLAWVASRSWEGQKDDL